MIYNFGLFKNLTLVIPTYNRADLLLRLLKYTYKTYPNILILDSSSNDDKLINKNNITQLNNNSNIKYIEFENTIRADHKIYKGLLNVETTYVVMCADDDMLFETAVRKALIFLDNNIDFICADGIYLNFLELNKKIEIGIEYPGFSCNDNLPLERVFSLLKNYESLFYSVSRTNKIIPVYKMMGDIKSHHFEELFQSVAFVLLGKTYRMPEFFAARNRVQPADKNRENWQTYMWFAKDSEEFISHYGEYRSKLYEFVTKHTIEFVGSKFDFLKVIDISHAIFFSENCNSVFFVEELKKDGLFLSKKNRNENALNILNGSIVLKIELLPNLILEKILKLLPLYINPFNYFKFFYFYSSIFLLSSKILKIRPLWIVGIPKFKSAFVEIDKYLKIN